MKQDESLAIDVKSLLERFRGVQFLVTEDGYVAAWQKDGQWSEGYGETKEEALGDLAMAHG